jgi:hypothetical protein
MAFIGSEALRSGRLTRGHLRWNYSAIHPDVYVEKGVRRSLAVNTEAAALWVPGGIITGRAAAALHGARFVDDDAPIEVIGHSRRPRPGVVVRSERIAADETMPVGGLTVSTPVRTALDLARHLPRTQAVAHLDALAAATGLTPPDVLALARRYPGARGIRRARHRIPLLDPGAGSPRESWLRLLVIDAGFPRPETQVEVRHGGFVAFVDLGWREEKIGLEYDGDHHLSQRRHFVKDISRHETLSRLGWLVIRVVREHGRAFILKRLDEAFRRAAKST